MDNKKKLYYFVLTILTIAMLALITFAKVNSIAGWVDLSKYEKAIGYVSSYGPVILVCLFAFGSLFGKLVSKIFFVLIILLLVVFTISVFAPELISNIFNSGAKFLLR